MTHLTRLGLPVSMARPDHPNQLSAAVCRGCIDLSRLEHISWL
jgi:hypothetical protein